MLDDDRSGGVRVLLKRDDLIHPQLCGNKWRKLKYLLPEIGRAGGSTVLTFGGAYSNHVRAVAAAGRAFGFETIGVIRGEERPYNDSLAAAESDGMRLHYLDRAAYRRKTEPDVLAALHGKLGEFVVIPEGGTTVHAIAGCRELVEEIDEPFDTIMCAVGTGGTIAGLSAGLPPDSGRWVSARCGASRRSTRTWPRCSGPPWAGCCRTGGSTTASTAEASPGALPSWTGSSTTSATGTASNWTTCMSAR